VADVRHDYVQSIGSLLAEVDPQRIDETLAGQARAGRDLIGREGVEVDAVEVSHEADLLYRGQSHILRIPIDSPGFDPAVVLERFSQAYLRRFDVELSEMRAVLSAVRTTITGRRPALAGNLSTPSPGLTDATPHKQRPVYFEGRWLDTSIYQREHLPEGAAIEGPAIVEQLDTTVLIDPGATAAVDRSGNLIVDVS
jgi:N-methylhydantoinase A